MSQRLWLSRIVACLAVGGVAAIGAMVDPSNPGRTDLRPPVAFRAPDHPHMPAFHGERGSPLGDSMRTSGADVTLRHFETDESPEQVADFYERSFSDLGRDVVRFDWEGVTHLASYGDDGAILTVNLFHQEPGTLVVPGVSRGGVLPGAEAHELPFAIPEEAMALVTNVTVDGGRKSSTAQFIVGRPMDSVAVWIADEFSGAGYNELPRGQMEGMESSFVLRFERGIEESNVGLQCLGEELGTMVFVLHEGPMDKSVRGGGDRNEPW